MTNGEKVQYLRRYLEARNRQAELARELEQLQSDACRVTPLLSGMPGRPSDGQSLPRAVERIIQAQQKLEAQINVCGATRREIVAVIEQVKNPRDHEILRRRYLLGQTWEQIAVEMHYGYQHVCKCHKYAVAKLAIECYTQMR